MLLILSIAIVSHSKVLTLLVLQWMIALSPPPPTDGPNAGDPTPGTLRLGNFIIEGVDRVSEEQELSDHVIVFTMS
jgi:hypothetical protein